MEDESGISLERFFDQWVYRKGHPVIDIDILSIKRGIKSCCQADKSIDY